MTSLRLEPPLTPAPLPPLDADQLRVSARVLSGDPEPLAVVGAPGSGKSTLAVALAASAVGEGSLPPERVLVVAATRTGAARVRDALALASGKPTGTPTVRTAASAAFAVLAAHAESLSLPRPTLMTGAEQDVLIGEMLDSHRRGVVAGPDWEGIVPREATALAGFRQELRNLMMRAAERGDGPDQLRALGEQTGRPEWLAAADFYQEYQDVMMLAERTADRGPRYDPAAVVSEAAQALASWESEPEHTKAPPRWDLVIVDDYQDATTATAHLLTVLRSHGSRIVLLGNADQAVQGFRGADAGGLDRATAAPAQGGLGAVKYVLTGRYRQAELLGRVADAVTARIGVRGGGSARAERGDAAEPDGRVSVLVARTSHQQARAIAATLRRAQRGADGAKVPWNEMAVIARSAAQLRELRTALLAADIPCESSGEGVALHREPAVAPLLTMMRVALGEEWNADSLTSVVGSRVLGIDTVAMRRLKRALVHEERSAGGQRTGDALVLDAMQDARRWESLGTVEAKAMASLCAAVDAARAIAEQPSSTPGAVVWALWDALGVAEQWRRGAIAGSARDDADLDAVISLMRAAQNFAERMPGVAHAQFITYLDTQDFAADSLGARAQASDVVSLATPASAAGREWELVVIAGLEEGAWPNTKLRDSVLGAQDYVEVLVGRAEAVALSPEARVAAAHAARREVVNDETRALLMAVSRARRTLVVTCVEGEDSAASRFIPWIEEAAGCERTDAAEVRGIADMRHAVAKLRADGAAAQGDERQAHAAMLATLAQGDIAGANPASWHGNAELSTDAPFFDDHAVVKVSPSKVDSLEECALRWALTTAGGDREGTVKQRVGTLIHELAAEHPKGSEAELQAALDARWHEVGGRDTWPELREYEKARDMVRRLATYLTSSTATEVRPEENFSITVDGARLAGQADRVEITDGAARIVDLKTGAQVSQKDADTHGQLAMYQLATELGGFDGVERASGASLVFVAHGVAKPSERIQAPIDVPEQRERLGAVASTMKGAVFLASPNASCERCPVQRSCPARAAGRQVTDS